MTKLIEIGSEVDLRRISDETVQLCSGARIFGPRTYIADGARIGTEGPATVVNCHIGPGVELKSGYFENAVFLEGAKLGFGSHVRGGTIVEEYASTAHCVGLKQTILFPYVTLGSLINFCDALMAGGTSRENHSEIGSSFIHFNYTPNQDKATASLLGDVPNGVMLNQRPIFLGGQGGLVGPARIAYGTVSAAGTIIRKDQMKPNHLVFGGAGKGGSIAWKPGGAGGARRIIRNNLCYLGNLFALRSWYVQVRRRFVSAHFPEELLAGLVRTLDSGLDERIKRLRRYIQTLNKPEIIGPWEKCEASFQDFDQERGHNDLRDDFLKKVEAAWVPGRSYVDTIKAFDPRTAASGTRWLASIVDAIADRGSQLE
ncbi:MAG: protein GlmU [Desulfobacterales bacterium]|nr:protein GlmU [Desulfobacterales bacterium]